METKILGERKKGRLEELMNKAQEDPAFKEVFEGETKKENRLIDFPKFKPCSLGLNLVKAVEKHIGFKENGLILSSKYEESDLINTLISPKLFDNVALALAYHALGRDDDAFNLMKKIKETWVVFSKITHDNALLSITYKCLGQPEKARIYMRFIANQIGYESNKAGYFVYHAKEDVKNAKAHLLFNNAAVALAYMCLGEEGTALRFVKGADNSFEHRPQIASNAFLAMAYLGVCRDNDARKIITALEHLKYKSFEDGLSLVYCRQSDNIPFYSTLDNLSLALAFMMNEYYKIHLMEKIIGENEK